MFVWKLPIKHSDHCHEERASGKAPCIATMKDREAVTHPRVMVVALFDAPGASTWSVEAVHKPRSPCGGYHLLRVKHADPAVAVGLVQDLEISLALFGSSSQTEQMLSCCTRSHHAARPPRFPRA